MERLFTYGNTYVLAHNGMTFIAFKSILNKDTVDVIGCYKGTDDIVKRVRRNSLYGQKIIEALEKDSFQARGNPRATDQAGKATNVIKGVNVNKTEWLSDGTIIMFVEVDGKEQKRRCHIEVDILDGNLSSQKLVPEIRDGEMIFEPTGGDIRIVRISRCA